MIFSIKLYLLLLLWVLIPTVSSAQQVFTHADSLRGSITAERAWWNLQHYDLRIRVLPEKKEITGSNTVTFSVLQAQQKMQIDLQSPLQIDSVLWQGLKLPYSRVSPNVFVIDFGQKLPENTSQKVQIYYAGRPVEARRPPWDGGLQWTTDTKGNHWIATSCQGIGASIWWPCKDHCYDEPDQGINISVTVPAGYIDVSNGKLMQAVENQDNTTTFMYKVTQPINNYGVNMNIGKYTSWTDTYAGEKGNLPITYVALAGSEAAARRQYAEVPRMLKAFEYWFGPYPFYEDGYKIVHVPYLGMEHQSSVTYGNKFGNGYLGTDLSGTGIGMLWDFIIVHESGHEWWGNNLTYQDLADMWLHESFTAYSETLFTEFHFGKTKANTYLQGTRHAIKNQHPIIGPYHVNAEIKDTDPYYKGANMIHTIRQLINNDSTFRAMLRHLQAKFYHQTVSSAEVEKAMSDFCKKDFSLVFDQYLRQVQVPVLQYSIANKRLKYRYANCKANFAMPIRVFVNKHEKWLQATTSWQSIAVGRKASLSVDGNFYINTRKLK
jgi:aminopeptidase N